MMNFGYITNGKLYCSIGERLPTEIKSEFAEQVVRRHKKFAEKHQWKSASEEGDMFGYNLWSQSASASDRPLVKINSVAAAPNENAVFYTLQTESIGGLFKYDFEEQYEKRIFHKESIYITDLCHHPDSDEFVCAMNDGGVQSIAVLSDEKFDYHFITEGDSIDAAPSWVPGEADTIVYQSAGVGRNQAGLMVHYGNTTIEKLNFSNGEQSTILADDACDYLCPRYDEHGNLYCIRRKCEHNGQRIKHTEAIKDFFLIPFRLLKALFGFLNLISQIFGKQSLVNATTGKKTPVDKQTIFLKGRLIDLAKEKDVEGSIVPGDWELIKMSPDGTIGTLAKNVSDYTVQASGLIIYTNGYSIIKLDQQKIDELFKSKEIIESLVVL